MKRLLALALVAGGLAAATVPAQAAPWCGPYGGIRCTPDGRRFCQVYVADPDTCLPHDILPSELG